jgi:adenine-specific DNA-methyltransferase
MVSGGELVVIIPRSFCNGPYYKPFRKALLKKTAIKTIHLFDSRKQAFKDDGVLQENVILHLVKGKDSKDVLISTSVDSSFSDLKQFTCDIGQIINPRDGESFIHIPNEVKKTSLENSHPDRYSLKEIGLEVSTGPVVDFRSKNNLHKMPLKGDAPLLYPAHFEGNIVKWPKKEIRKSNSISINDETKKMLFPKGFYVLVKRFSSKEEKKRICAALLSPEQIKAETYGFENHLNVFHIKKMGLNKDVAHGLMVYLNSSSVDTYFREFNGHTQVNATDLRAMKYPSIEDLKSLGKMAKSNKTNNQSDIDEMVNTIP